MDLARLAVGPPPAKVAETIGVFTNDIRVAQDFFHAGLPFWLMWPASDLGETNILTVTPLLVLRYYGLCFESHHFNYPVIYQGSASSTQKHEAILRYACNFLRYPDPFALHTSNKNTSASTRVETSVGLQASKIGPGTRAVVGNNHQCGTNKGRGPYGSKGKGAVRKLPEYFSCMPSHHPTKDNKQKSSNSATGRDKFDMYESPLMPLPIPVWRDALKAVKRDEARHLITRGIYS
jgi:hypothetical protein